MIKGIKTYIITASSGSNAICFIVTGFIAAYVSGLFAVKFLLKFSEKRNLNIFAVYCVLVSLIFFIVYFIRK
jgi:undecaprenyl pyrophosphate phosphatase UppP